MVGKLDDSVSFASVRAHLGKLGYADDGGVWTIDADDSTVTPELASTLAAVTLVPSLRLVVAADRAGVRHRRSWRRSTATRRRC